MSDPKKWEAFLTPEITKERLISAAMYLTAFEFLKTSIIDRIRDFFSDGVDQNGLIVSDRYRDCVLSRNKSTLYASLQWLRENEAINDADFLVFERAKETRNNIAHRLPDIVLTDGVELLAERFQEMTGLLKKIEVWWIINVEMAIDPERYPIQVDEAEITPGPLLILQMMLEVINGNEELLAHYRQAAATRST